MAAAKALGDEHIEAPAEDLIFRIAEDSLGPEVPELDHSAAVSEDHSVGEMLDVTCDTAS